MSSSDTLTSPLLLSDDTSSWVEQAVIGVALLAGLPLGFFLDTELLGFRRFVWIGASFLGLYNLLLLDTTSETADHVDKMCLSLLSVALVPHFVKLVRDQTWMGLGVLPPFFAIVHASLHTPVGSRDYWRLRAFLHMFVFIMPYLNHLPSSTPTAAPKNAEEDAKKSNGVATTVENDNTNQKPANGSAKKSTKSRTNKKKR